MPEETLRAKAKRMANKTGVTHLVLVNRHRSERPGRVLKLGQIVPLGWKIVDRVAPDPEHDTGADKRISELLNPPFRD